MWSFWRPRDRFSLEELRYLNDQLHRNILINDYNKGIIVETLRSVSELLIWGDQHEPSFFKFFMENEMLILFLRILRNAAGYYNDVIIQLLQTLNIIILNTQNNTALNHMFNKDHINSIILFPFNFSNEELLAYYISLLRTISMKLNSSTLSCFLYRSKDDSLKFPLYTEAIKFFHHEESMIRIAVRTLTLNVYNLDDEQLRHFIVNTAAVSYFEDLANFVRQQSFALDSLFIEVSNSSTPSTSVGRLETCIAEIGDLLFYCNDIMSSKFSDLAKILSDHLLRLFILPVLLPSLCDRDVELNSTGAFLSPLCAMYLLSRIILISSFKPLLEEIISRMMSSISSHNTTIIESLIKEKYKSISFKFLENGNHENFLVDEVNKIGDEKGSGDDEDGAPLDEGDGFVSRNKTDRIEKNLMATSSETVEADERLGNVQREINVEVDAMKTTHGEVCAVNGSDNEPIGKEEGRKMDDKNLWVKEDPTDTITDNEIKFEKVKENGDLSIEFGNNGKILNDRLDMATLSYESDVSDTSDNTNLSANQNDREENSNSDSYLDSLIADFDPMASFWELILSYLLNEKNRWIVASLSIIVSILQNNSIHDAMLDSLGILPRKRRHRQLLMQALVSQQHDMELNHFFSAPPGKVEDDIQTDLRRDSSTDENDRSRVFVMQKIEHSEWNAKNASKNRKQILNGLMNIVCRRPPPCAEALWHAGWLLHQLLPHHQRKLSPARQRFLEKAYHAAKKDLMHHLSDCWCDLLPSVVEEEWKVCKKSLEMPSLQKDSSFILLPHFQVYNNDNSSCAAIGERMRATCKTFISLHQMRLLFEEGSIPEKTPFNIPNSDFETLPKPTRTGRRGVHVHTVNQGTVLELGAGDAMSCRVAFEKGKEESVQFVVASGGVHGWLLLTQPLPKTNTFKVRMIGPLAGCQPRIDSKHPHWLQLRIRTSTMPSSKAGTLGSTHTGKPRRLTDGIWVLAFPDDQRCKFAYLAVMEEMQIQSSCVRSILQPLLDTDESSSPTAPEQLPNSE